VHPEDKIFAERPSLKPPDPGLVVPSLDLFSISFKVTFRRIGKKGNNDACKIRRLWSDHQVDDFMTQQYRPILLVAQIVCKICLVSIAKYRDIWSSKRPPDLFEEVKIIIAMSESNKPTCWFYHQSLDFTSELIDFSSSLNSLAAAYNLCSLNAGCSMGNWMHSTGLRWKKHV